MHLPAPFPLLQRWRKWCVDDAKLPVVPAHQCPNQVFRLSECYRLKQCQLHLGGAQILVCELFF